MLPSKLIPRYVLMFFFNALSQCPCLCLVNPSGFSSGVVVMAEFTKSGILNYEFHIIAMKTPGGLLFCSALMDQSRMFCRLNPVALARRNLTPSNQKKPLHFFIFLAISKHLIHVRLRNVVIIFRVCV